MKRLLTILFFTTIFVVPGAQAAGIDQLLSQVVKQRVQSNLELEGGESEDGDEEHGRPDFPGQKVWTGSATFFSNPDLGFEFQWNAIELMEGIRLIQVMRAVDGAGQNGILIELEESDFGIALHPAFGADAATCKYIFLGKKTGNSFSGSAYYKCDGGTTQNGNFSAHRL